MTIVPINEGKEIIKKYEELWSKIRELCSSMEIIVGAIFHENIKYYPQVFLDKRIDAKVTKI